MQRDRNLITANSSSKHLQQPVLALLRPRHIYNLLSACQQPRCLSHLPLTPRLFFIRDWLLKWNRWTWNKFSKIGCECYQMFLYQYAQNSCSIWGSRVCLIWSSSIFFSPTTYVCNIDKQFFIKKNRFSLRHCWIARIRCVLWFLELFMYPYAQTRFFFLIELC